MLTDQAHGTQTAVIGTEHTLVNANTTAGLWALQVNLRNMVDGDEVELRAYVKTLTGDATGVLIHSAKYVNKQGDANGPGASGNGSVVAISPGVPSLFAISWTLKQIAGTGRNYDWLAMTF